MLLNLFSWKELEFRLYLVVEIVNVIEMYEGIGK